MPLEVLRWRAALLVTIVGLGGGSLSGCTGRKPETHTVTIEGMRFQPAALTVKAGDAVVWVNRDLFAHTATSSGPGFDSQSLSPGASWTFVAAGAGEFRYICTLHPTMKGVLRVE